MKALITVIFGLLFTATAQAVRFSRTIIEPDAATLGPGVIIENFYNFAIAIGGLLAFGAIVYGAIKYSVSANNPSQQSDAKDWIRQALWGLLLLAGATIILVTLNPFVFKDFGAGVFIENPQITPPEQVPPFTGFQGGGNFTGGAG